MVALRGDAFAGDGILEAKSSRIRAGAKATAERFPEDGEGRARA
jgi:hypothetical protein